MVEARSTRDAYGEALVALGEEDLEIVVLDADLSVSTGTCKFARKFPERFFDVGCAEQNLIGVAAGLAAGGKTVFASTYAVFASGRAWEQIRFLAHDELNVKIVVTHAGLTNSSDGASHQSLEDMALMRVIPGMTVIVPVDFVEAEKAIKASAAIPGPVYIRLNRTKTPTLFDVDYVFEAGKGVELKNGDDMSIIATGTMVAESLKAAEMLEREGIHARVVNLHTIKPLDQDIILKAADETGAVLTVEEHSIYGGLGSAVAEVLMQENKPTSFRIRGTMDRFGQSGDYDELLMEYGLDSGSIYKAAKLVFKDKNKR
ncbi:MAG: transketolase family protein [Candidatus Altiarchaeota archaeon]|nr:transketolase family protein [Candidatus Altiarchaeota archaeon]